MTAVKRRRESAVAAIERQRWLDAPGYKLEHGLALSFTLFGTRARAVQDALHGTWLGHPLHPMLTDVPLGAWTVAALLDAADIARPGRTRAAAQLAVGVGVLGGTAAAVAGATDWQHTHDEARRSGLVHGVMNSIALVLQAQSWRHRRHGRLARARLDSGLGYAFVLAGGYLGGALVFRHRIGVDHSQDEPGPSGPSEFVAVLADADLAEDAPHPVECDGAPVVLMRHDGVISALGGRCPHLGAPMSQGWIYRSELVCPWHGSRFDAATGCVKTGPATAPLTRYETRTIGGTIEVRRLTETDSPRQSTRGAGATR